MWFIFGLLAILFATLHVIITYKGKKFSLFGFLSMAFTSCTVCASYSLTAKWVVNEDWAALMDVVPLETKMLWNCVIASIAINGICFIIQELTKKGE